MLKDGTKRRKRGQGEGTIYKRKDGGWTAVANLGYQNGKLKRKYTMVRLGRKRVTNSPPD